MFMERIEIPVSEATLPARPQALELAASLRPQA